MVSGRLISRQSDITVITGKKQIPQAGFFLPVLPDETAGVFIIPAFGETIFFR
jgi:hypothetical protein